MQGNFPLFRVSMVGNNVKGTMTDSMPINSTIFCARTFASVGLSTQRIAIWRRSFDMRTALWPMCYAAGAFNQGHPQRELISTAVLSRADFVCQMLTRSGDICSGASHG